MSFERVQEDKTISQSILNHRDHKDGKARQQNTHTSSRPLN